MTKVHNILIVLALVSAISIVNSKHALRDRAVFPDDLQWLSSSEKGDFEDNSINDADPTNYKICETTECKQVADEFLSSMNRSVDPCDDFYEFSCGGWSSTDVIPPSLPTWSRIMIFQNTVNYRIKAVLETEPKASDILPVRQAKKWYRSCMDSETIERRGVKPIESILMQAGGWPISMDDDEWDGEEYTWQKVEREYARSMSSYVFYDIEAGPPSEYSKSGEIRIGAPEIPLEDQLPLKYRNYTGNDYEAYVRLIASAADLFVRHNRADVTKDKVRKEAEEIVEFEKEIYKIKKRGWFSKVLTIEKLIEWSANVTEETSDPATNNKQRIEWKSVIQTLFDTVNIKVHPNSHVSMTDVDYFRRIGRLLGKTSSRTIVNYIHWKFVSDMLPYTTELVRDEIFALVKDEYGLKERPPRWSECINDMKMTHAAAYAFVNNFFTKSTKTAVLDMIENVQDELNEQIDKSNWLEKKSKKLLRDKLNRMKIFVGFPKWYNNRTAMINHYKGLTIGAEYFDNSLSYMRYKKKNILKRFAKKRDTDEPEELWHIDPITANALYDPSQNTVNVPAVDFQSPLFTPGLPDNVNYGIAGVLVGHEMSHGFDDQGIRYSTDGRGTKLSKDMLRAYYQRAGCFLDQFEGYYGETEPPQIEEETEPPEVEEETTSEYEYEEMEVWRNSKGMRTRSENIADTTGIQTVFEAYRKRTEPAGVSRLPGLEEFTDDQLFFLSFAAMCCEIATPQFAEKRAQMKDPHSAPRYRVIGAVSNTKDFARAFNCPKGSSMNPIDKCNIWTKPGAIPKTESGCDKRMNHRWGSQWKD